MYVPRTIRNKERSETASEQERQRCVDRFPLERKALRVEIPQAEAPRQVSQYLPSVCCLPTQSPGKEEPMQVPTCLVCVPVRGDLYFTTFLYCDCTRISR